MPNELKILANIHVFHSLHLKAFKDAQGLKKVAKICGEHIDGSFWHK